ncbi:MAG: 4'-phosphopantetheinyl transferase superfamily protein [Planctomycetota bacterium]
MQPTGQSTADTQGKVSVWRWPLDAEMTAEGLSAEESRRADRFYHERDRRRFLVAHHGLRRVLGDALGIRPAEVTLQTGPHGKPSLAGVGPRRLEFNLTHSGEWALLALSDDGPVGVDLEQQRPVGESQAIADRHYAQLERSRAPDPDSADYERWFFETWTAKEAALKLLGAGLALPLHQVETPPADGWAELPRPNPLQLARCWIGRLDAPDGFRAALATPQRPQSVAMHTLEQVV